VHPAWLGIEALQGQHSCRVRHDCIAPYRAGACPTIPWQGCAVTVVMPWSPHCSVHQRKQLERLSSLMKLDLAAPSCASWVHTLLLFSYGIAAPRTLCFKCRLNCNTRVCYGALVQQLRLPRSTTQIQMEILGVVGAFLSDLANWCHKYPWCQHCTHHNRSKLLFTAC
jgi:hypothetical protein